MTERRSFRDAELVRRTQDGDRSSFGELLERHEPAIRTLAASWIEDEQMVESLAMAAFHRAYRYLDRFDPVRNFRPWLLKIAVNLLFDDARRRPLGPLPPVPGGGLDRLRPLPRVILALQAGLGMREEEIAESLAIPTEVVAERLLAARREVAAAGGPGERVLATTLRARAARGMPGTSPLERLAARYDLGTTEASWIRPERPQASPPGRVGRRARMIQGGVVVAAVVLAALVVLLSGESPQRPGGASREREMADRYRAWRRTQEPSARAPEPDDAALRTFFSTWVAATATVASDSLPSERSGLPRDDGTDLLDREADPALSDSLWSVAARQKARLAALTGGVGPSPARTALVWYWRMAHRAGRPLAASRGDLDRLYAADRARIERMLRRLEPGTGR